MRHQPIVRRRLALALAGSALAAAGSAHADCGEHWLPQVPGPASSVFALATADIGGGEILYAGGSFASAGGTPANRIAYWDGSQWHAMGAGLSDPAVAEVYSIRKFQQSIIVGGQFTFAGGIPANRIARWDGPGSGDGWSPLGAGVTGAVWALEEYDGDLIAGGFFKSAGGTTANRIARWDSDTSSWHAMGPTGSDGMNGPVFALAIYNGDLIAGGDFTTAGGAPANYIARWDGDSSTGGWQPLGGGVDAPVRALLVHDGTLIVGGRFANAGGAGGVPAKMIATWDGNEWTAVGKGFAGGFIAPAVEALASFKGNIIAGGNFTTSASGDPAFSRIARWDGDASGGGGGSWHPLGQGVNSTVWALTTFNDELHLGGYLTTVIGGQAMPYWGRWDIANAPQINRHPAGTAAPAGGVASFTVGAAGVDLMYQWRRDGVPLEDDERVTGVHAATLTIDPVEPGDAGTYDVIVASPCGTLISDAAQLTVGSVPGDLTGDGSVGVADLLILLASWGPCADCAPEDCPADLSGDCTVGVADLLILLANWG